MGYESRVYVMKRVEFECPSGNIVVSTEEIACFNMCKMGREFHKLFVDDIDYDLYFYNELGEKATRKDLYGDICKHASVSKVRDWLRKEAMRNDYRRIPPLLAFLEAFDESLWKEGEIQLVHFGY